MATTGTFRKPITRRCSVCNKKLRSFETRLCRCEQPVCIKHAQRELHECTKRPPALDLIRVVCEKIKTI